MFDETEKYKKQDHFFWSADEKLSSVTTQVPDEPGVFFIYRLAHGRVELVYIGNSKVLQGPELRATGLRDEINQLENIFKPRLKKEGIEALDIYWHVTLDENHNDLPGYVGGLLMQRHFEVHGELPGWNESFL